jgi:hypothetical protein
MSSEQYIDKYIFLTGGLNECVQTEMKDESTQSTSAETFQGSLGDFIKSAGSSRENLAELLEEVRRVWDQNGSGSFEETILKLLPVESIAQYIKSRLVSDP